jgi:iron complex outermembrane recepter protein
MHGLSLKSDTRGTWDWELAASLYDYGRDEVRSPLVALPAAEEGGTGRITGQDGTGWNSLALKGTWRPGGIDGAHVVDVGYQREAYRLRTLVSNTDNWLSGQATTRFSAFQGDTRLQSLYAQDTWRFAADWRATLGVRFEDWQASNGALSNAAATLPFPERSEQYASPKAAIAWQVTPDWALKASVGRAVRNPTVAELYQGSISSDTIVNNDPDLKPEKSWTGELTAEREFERGSLRTTFFHEDTRDALYSQTQAAATGNVTTIQNVDHIRTSGLEIALQLRDVAVDGLDLMSSLTYAHSRIVENDNFPDSEGKWQPRVPEWRGNLLATYRIGDRWTTSLGARYSGRQYNTLDNADLNGFTYMGTSSYFVVDARARYRITEQCTASLGIDNLNNETY